MRLTSSAVGTFILSVTLVAPAGAQGAGARAAASATTHPAQTAVKRPLGELASRRVAVAPAQLLTFSDTSGWSEKVPPARKYLAQLDDEIAYALGERGLGTAWISSDAVRKSARRNVTFTSDPRTLDVGQLRVGVRAYAWQLKEPLASQLRSLVALGDARYVLIPVEVRFVDAGRGAVRATLRLALVDARRSQVQWSGDVAGAPAAAFSPAVAADLASRLADLIAPVN